MTRADDGCHLWTAGTGRGAPLIACHGGPGLERALRRVTRVVSPDAGCVPWLEVPGELASLVVDWLREASP